MPLVTLDEPIKPLVSFVPELSVMFDKIRRECNTPLDDLSWNESASIMLYSLGWSPTENSFYVKLNSVLRNAERHKLPEPWFLYLKLFLTALSKLASKTLNVYRGVKRDISDEYPLAKEFVWWPFTSCTSTIGVLEKDIFLGKNGPRTCFTIACHSGKDISQHSTLVNENQILLLAARQFKVISRADQANHLHLIQLEEIEPTHPLLARLPVDHTPVPLHDNDDYQNDEIEQIISKCQFNKLDLRGKCLNDRDMGFVATRGVNEKQCKILDLSGIEVTKDGISILACALHNNTHLEELNLSGAIISDSGVRSLTSVINSSVLKCLKLEANDISDEGAKHLAEIFRTNTKLIQLSLSVNQITSCGVNMLAEALILPNICLQILNLSANTNIDDKCIDSIVTMSELNQSLKKLDLRCCDFSEDGKDRLRTVVKSKKRFDFWL